MRYFKFLLGDGEVEYARCDADGRAWWFDTEVGVWVRDDRYYVDLVYTGDWDVATENEVLDATARPATV